MRNSWKLGLFAALCVSTAMVGCGDDDDSTSNTGGSGGSSAGKGGSTNNGGSSAGKGGTTSGGTSTGGKGGATSGGSGGKGGTGGTAGKGGTASGGGEGGAAAGADTGGAGGAGGAGECMEEAVGGAAPEGAGGAGGAPAAETAVVLFDNITVKNGATVVKTWAFDNGNDIADVLKGDVGDKWLRPPFDTNPVNLAYSSPYAHDVFAKCDGKPAGSLAAIVPFTAAAQYYKMGIGFASADWSGYTITADIKLVSGGNNEGACGMQAGLFVQDGAGPLTGERTYLNVVDGWKTMTLTVPASTNVDHLSIIISDYTCL
ncbi:MAG TPA: hypothetical protein VHB79_21110 [Polyangiaceae bacterium]|nr:hypothetical protein [Polyangiaceae bacterium]